MKHPVYVLCNGSDAFVGHAASTIGAKRIASKYGYKVTGSASLTARGRFVLTGKGFEGRV